MQVRKWVLGAGTVVAVVAVSAGVLWWGATSDSEPGGQQTSAAWPSYGPGEPVPAEARRVAETLASGDERAQRDTVMPELADVLPPGRLFPPGTTLRLDENSWHEHDGHANAAGQLSMPGEPSRKVVVGFVEQDGAWRVVFAEVIP